MSGNYQCDASRCPAEQPHVQHYSVLKFNSTTNILITGAFGFVGASLSATLTSANKHRLIAVDLVELDHHHYSEFITWDELQTLNGRNIDSVIYLAGKAYDTNKKTKRIGGINSLWKYRNQLLINTN